MTGFRPLRVLRGVTHNNGLLGSRPSSWASAQRCCCVACSAQAIRAQFCDVAGLLGGFAPMACLALMPLCHECILQVGDLLLGAMCSCCSLKPALFC